jgi:uncharacterized protein YlxP (DUF503 family)
MHIGIVKFHLFLPESRSLKAKRSAVNSLKERLARLNASVAEVDGQDLWQRAVLGVAVVTGQDGAFDPILQRMLGIIDHEVRVQLLDYTVDRTSL